MKELNLLQAEAAYYTAAPQPEAVTIGTARFISIPGKGSPSEAIFRERIAVLSAAAQALKGFYDTTEEAFAVSVLEGLYWHDERVHGFIGVAEIFSKVPLSELHYRLLIRVPAYVTPAAIEKAQAALVAEGNSLANTLEFFEHTEGAAVQMLHLGAFKYEEETLLALEQHMQANHLVKGGLHHEIYLTDFTKVKTQEHLRTILREPVRAEDQARASLFGPQF